MEIDNSLSEVLPAGAEDSASVLTGGSEGLRELDQEEVREILLEEENRSGSVRSQASLNEPILTRIQRRTRELEVLVEQATSGRLVSTGRQFFEGAEDLSPAEHDAAVQLYIARRDEGTTSTSPIEVDSEDDNTASTAGCNLVAPSRERIAVARVVTAGELEREERRTEQTHAQTLTDRNYYVGVGSGTKTKGGF